jgi:hypothetical protein
MKSMVFYGKVLSLLLALTASGFFGYFLGFNDQAEVNRKAHIENYRVGLYTGMKEAHRRQQLGLPIPRPTPAIAASGSMVSPSPSVTAMRAGYFADGMD